MSFKQINNYHEILAFIALKYISKYYYKTVLSEWDNWRIPSSMDASEIVPNVILKFNETNTMIQLSKLPPLRKAELLIKENPG